MTEPMTAMQKANLDAVAEKVLARWLDDLREAIKTTDEFTAKGGESAHFVAMALGILTVSAANQRAADDLKRFGGL